MERGYGEQPVGFLAYLIFFLVDLDFYIRFLLHFLFYSLPFVTGLVRGRSVYSIFGVLSFYSLFSSYPCFCGATFFFFCLSACGGDFLVSGVLFSHFICYDFA